MIIALIGPTAVGKTKLSIELAQKFNAEIVCVDSLLVYRDFNIGTAKPTVAEQKTIPHYCINIADPSNLFTAYDFCEAATGAIEKIQKKNKNVFLVGGSGLYFKALTQGMFQAPPSDPKIREALEERLSQDPKALYEELCRGSLKTSQAIHPNDHYRILRALEVYHMTGKSFSQYQEDHVQNKKKNFGIKDLIKIGLNMDRPLLYQNIEQRTAHMLKEGLIEEVRELQKKYSLECKPFQSVGYKETIQFLNIDPPIKSGDDSLKGLFERINQATRQLAKGQMTWFRADSEISWFLPSDPAIHHKIAKLL
ncbi:MAG: tRNA (adenosine(37)-N6)-dimethylallyltransferase MiaA [Deltaproteobacteria bacterium]|nr:tRNA (adenosine(37)-N6)-dimethylallyltransferase MiaA [Deltaproteobacteria bacterium]